MIELDKKILLIDDQPEITDIIAEFIIDKYPNVKVTESNSSLEGISLSKQHKYDLIITDHHMPEKSGTDVLREVRQTGNLNKLTPIIFVTAMKSEVEREIAQDFSDVYVFNKVDKIQKIIDVIEIFIS